MPTRSNTVHERWRDRAGMSETECMTLVAVLAHWNKYERPVTLPEIRAFLQGLEECRSPEVTALVKRGWVRVADRVRVARCSRAAAYEPTARGWAILGFEVPRKAA